MEYRETPIEIKDAEKALLGALLMEPGMLYQVDGILKPEYFSDRYTKGIYLTLQRLITEGKSAGIVEVRLELPKSLKDGLEPDFIGNLVDVRETRLFDHVEAYVGMMREDYQKQKLHDMATRAIQAIEEDGADPVEIADQLKQAIDLSETVQDDELKPWTFDDMKAEFQKTKEGLKTGFKELDKMIRIKPGAITVIAGRPGEGKTTFLYNVMLNMAKKDPDSYFLFVSYEEARRKIALKMLVNLSGVSLDDYRNQEAFEHVLRNPDNFTGAMPSPEAAAGFSKGVGNITELLNSGRVTLHDRQPDVVGLVRLMRGFRRRYEDKAGAVFIDYVQLIQNRDKANATRQVIIQDVLRQVKKAAIDLDLPIVMAAQLGRPKTPVTGFSHISMDSLREAGDIEQDANTIITVQMDTQKQHIGLQVVKNREGNTHSPDNKPGSFILLEFDSPILRIGGDPKPTAVVEM